MEESLPVSNEHSFGHKTPFSLLLGCSGWSWVSLGASAGGLGLLWAADRGSEPKSCPNPSQAGRQFRRCVGNPMFSGRRRPEHINNTHRWMRELGTVRLSDGYLREGSLVTRVDFTSMYDIIGHPGAPWYTTNRGLALARLRKTTKTLIKHR